MREPKTIPPTTTPLTLSAICRAYASALASGVEPDRSVLVDSIAGETGIAVRRHVKLTQGDTQN